MFTLLVAVKTIIATFWKNNNPHTPIYIWYYKIWGHFVTEQITELMNQLAHQPLYTDSNEKWYLMLEFMSN